MTYLSFQVHFFCILELHSKGGIFQDFECFPILGAFFFQDAGEMDASCFQEHCFEFF